MNCEIRHFGFSSTARHVSSAPRHSSPLFERNQSKLLWVLHVWDCLFILVCCSKKQPNALFVSKSVPNPNVYEKVIILRKTTSISILPLGNIHTILILSATGLIPDRHYNAWHRHSSVLPSTGKGHFGSNKNEVDNKSHAFSKGLSQAKIMGVQMPTIPLGSMPVPSMVGPVDYKYNLESNANFEKKTSEHSTSLEHVTILPLFPVLYSIQAKYTIMLTVSFYFFCMLYEKCTILMSMNPSHEKYPEWDKWPVFVEFELLTFMSRCHKSIP